MFFFVFVFLDLQERWVRISTQQRHLRLKLNSKIDFFNDHEFFEFKRFLDSEMKRLQRKGLGSRKRQAQVLTIENEEKLWKSGLLGDSNPSNCLIPWFLQWIMFCFKKWTRTSTA